MSVLVTAPTASSVSGQEATLFDVVSTLFSSDKAVTGIYGFVQKAALVVAGMSLQNWRQKDEWNPFKLAK